MGIGRKEGKTSMNSIGHRRKGRGEGENKEKGFFTKKKREKKNKEKMKGKNKENIKFNSSKSLNWMKEILKKHFFYQQKVCKGKIVEKKEKMKNVSPNLI